MNALTFEKRIAVFQWVKKNPKQANGQVWTMPELRDAVKEHLKLECTLANIKSICKAAKIETDRVKNNGFAVAIGNLSKTVDGVCLKLESLHQRIYVMEKELEALKKSLGG